MSKYEYDAVVIGGGSAGLTASGIAAGIGAKTALIEANELGGDCTWTGCIPSKALIHIAELAHQTEKAEEYGAKNSEPVNAEKAFEYVRKKRQEVFEDADDPQIFRDMGIDVIYAKASFEDAHTLILKLNETGEEKQITARYIFIATGSHAQSPPIPGLRETPHLNNESLFELTSVPKSLSIIGAGPIGVEMGQALNRLGVYVTIIDAGDRILRHDDLFLTNQLKELLEKEGLTIHLDAKINEVTSDDSGKTISAEIKGETKNIISDEILVAAGRAPNINGLNLEKAGINFSKRGIAVNDSGRTNKKNIYAIGDVAGRYQFTHMAEHMAKVAVSKAMMKIPMKFDESHIVWATYSSPEIAHLGATKSELDDKGITYETYKFPYTKVDRAVADDASEGWIVIYAKKLSGKILGASVLGKNAAELISEYALAMKNGVSLRNIADTIHPYPSYGLGARRGADQWYIKSQSPVLIKALRFIFRYNGPMPDLSDPDRIM